MRLFLSWDAPPACMQYPQEYFMIKQLLSLISNIVSIIKLTVEMPNLGPAKKAIRQPETTTTMGPIADTQNRFDFTFFCKYN